jgi:hypothetical protein
VATGGSDRSIRITLEAKDNASRVVGKFGEKVGDAGDKVEKLADDFQVAERAARHLDSEIERVESSLRDLAVAAAANPADADLMKRFRAEQRDLNRLKKLRSAIGEIGDEVADVAGKGFNLLGGTFASLPPHAMAGVAAAGVAIGATLSAAVGAAVASGVLLGLGGGVLAAGIKAAAGSPRVRSAWRAFAEGAKHIVADFGEPFEGPLARAAETFTNALADIANTGAFREIGEALAPVIDKLAPALADLAKNAMPGIVKAVKASAPLFDTLAKHAPKIGDAIGKFFNKIAQAGPGANVFLDDMLTLLEGLLPALGDVIGRLSVLYAAIRTGGEAAYKVMREAFRKIVNTVLASFGTIITGAAKAFGWMPGIGPKLNAAARKFWSFAASVNAALDGIEDEVVTVKVKVTGKITQGTQSTVGFGPAKPQARGGPQFPGHTYLVGEEGPELVTPTRAGFVHTAGKTAAMLGAAAARTGSGDNTAGTGAGIERAIARAMSNVAVFLDGQRVGRLEGRRADLLERGG